MTLRERVTVPCPGTAENIVRLTNSFTTPYGIQNLFNSGSCELFVGGLDSSGERIWGIEHLRLGPGESADSYYAPPGSDAIFVVCAGDCSGTGQLDYDTPVA